MFTVLSPNSFFRKFEEIGYLFDHSSRRDRVYDAIGAEMLGQIRRSPRPVDEMVASLVDAFGGAPAEQIRCDLLEMLQELASEGFVGIGTTEQDAWAAVPVFSYANPLRPQMPKADFAHIPRKTIADSIRLMIDHIVSPPL